MIRKNKRQQWRIFMDSLNYNTPTKIIFEKIKILNKALIPFANTNEDWVEDFLAHLTPDATFEKQWTEETIFTNNLEKFCIEELKIALKKLKKKNPGLDRIQVDCLIQLSPKGQNILLSIFNQILQTKKIPEAWKMIKIYPSLKKDQYPKLRTSYRPIGIISAVKKLFEKMILNRLEYKLESKFKLSPYQAGFRKGKNIYQNLWNISSNAYKALGEKKFMPCLFLDINNAYNNVQYHILLDKLRALGINIDLAKIIFNLITNNKVTLAYNFKTWGLRVQSKGLTQGGILSPILYLIYTAEVHKKLQHSSISEFADDIAIYSLDEDLNVAVTKLTSDFHEIHSIINLLGLDFSLSKTKFTIFTNRKIPQNFTINLLNTILTVQETVKYLGLLFHRKMNWYHHALWVKTKIATKLNILKYLHGSAWGINQNVSRLLFLSMIRPIMDYALPIYCNDYKISNKINIIQNNCLRKVLSVLGSTPTNNLNAEAAIPPIQYRFNFLTDKLILKSMSLRNNAIINDMKSLEASISESPWWSNKQYPLILIRWLKLKEYEPLIKKTTLPSSLSNNPKFQFFQPNIDFLNINRKIWIDPHLILVEFLKIINDKFPNYIQYYTDGGKSESYVTAVFTINNFFKLYKLSNFASIFDAEAYAIKRAIMHSLTNNHKNIIICSDSQNVLKNLLNQSSDLHPTINDIKSLLYHNQLNNIWLLWIPSHVGIPGNERADSLTKLLPLANNINDELYYKQLIPHVKKQAYLEWNQEWIECSWKGQKLKSICPKINRKPWFDKLKWNRSEIKNLIRLRIGHGNFPSHLNRLNLKDSDLCDCGLYGDLNHILFECQNLINRDILIQKLIENNYSPPFNVSYILHTPDPKIYKIIANFLKDNNINL
ncbi:unnamed protein product [Bemisia tabaci]|uniref:Uncharacterized protein n=1 Tax=Bemisia tabaci TaxID=7038 RepID=A0A9P0CAP4_BEMTA|nr:unnamed protein product [Bemisia tabaci]